MGRARVAGEFAICAVFRRSSTLKSPWEAVFIGAVSSFGSFIEELSNASINARYVHSWRVGEAAGISVFLWQRSMSDGTGHQRVSRADQRSRLDTTNFASTHTFSGMSRNASPTR
jgi:hypothetical protein